MIIFSPWRVSADKYSTSHFRLGDPTIYLHYDLDTEKWCATSSPGELPNEIFGVYFVSHQDINKVKGLIDQILLKNNCVLTKSISEYQKLSILQ